MHDEHIDERLRTLHDAVLDIVATINRPDRDAFLIREAGIRLDRALFPLLVLIERFGPVGVVDLAGRVGRDHSTVSRQVAKLAELGLAAQRTGEGDRRRREMVATDVGHAMARRIDAARDRTIRAALADWPPNDVDRLTELTCRYADALKRVAR